MEAFSIHRGDKVESRKKLVIRTQWKSLY